MEHQPKAEQQHLALALTGGAALLGCSSLPFTEWPEAEHQLEAEPQPEAEHSISLRQTQCQLEAEHIVVDVSPPVAAAGPAAPTLWSMSTCISMSTSSTFCSFLSLLEHMYLEILRR